MIVKPIIRELRAFMEKESLSQLEMSRIMGIDQGRLSRLLAGTRMLDTSTWQAVYIRLSGYNKDLAEAIKEAIFPRVPA